MSRKYSWQEDSDKIKEEIKQHIESELQIAFSAAALIPDSEEESQDIYAKKSEIRNPKSEIKIIDNSQPAPGIQNADGTQQSETNNPQQATTEKRFIDAIKEGLHQSMQQHENLVLMGQDIAEYGGAFKITEGFVHEFGKERVRNTPLCESAIVGSCLGLALEGFKSVMEMQFADFVTVGFNQIINNLAKIYYRWGQHADVVIRMPTGAGVGAGPFHSQSNEAWFVHTPGFFLMIPRPP